MYHGPFPSVALDACLRALHLPPDVEAWAREASLASGPSDGIRGVWFQKVGELVAVRCPDEAVAYDHLLATIVERRPHFAFLSSWRVLLGVLAAARLLHPDDAPAAAVTRAVAAASQAMLDQAMFKPLVLSCEGDFMQFMRLTAQSNRLFFAAGEIIYRADGAVSALDYEDHPAPTHVPLTLGFWRGALRCFGAGGDFVVEQHGPRRYSLICDPSA